MRLLFLLVSVTIFDIVMAQFYDLGFWWLLLIDVGIWALVTLLLNPETGG